MVTRELWCGATDAALLTSRPSWLAAAAPDLTDPEGAGTALAQTVSTVLARAVGDMAGTPVLLIADDYCADVATVFVRRCDRVGRSLRPSDSIRLEAAELLRHFAVRSAWRGPAHVLVTPGRAAWQALALSGAMTRRHGAVVLCELRPQCPPPPDAPPARPLAPYAVVTLTVTRSDSSTDRGGGSASPDGIGQCGDRDAAGASVWERCVLVREAAP